MTRSVFVFPLVATLFAMGTARGVRAGRAQEPPPTPTAVTPPLYLGPEGVVVVLQPGEAREVSVLWSSVAPRNALAIGVTANERTDTWRDADFKDAARSNGTGAVVEKERTAALQKSLPQPSPAPNDRTISVVGVLTVRADKDARSGVTRLFARLGDDEAPRRFAEVRVLVGTKSAAEVEKSIQQRGGTIKRDPARSGQPVVSIDLGHSIDPPLSDAELAELAVFPELRELSLAGRCKEREKNLLTSDGLKHLQVLGRLEKLDLSWQWRVADTGLVHLEGLANLMELNLDMTGVTRAGVKRLQAALPKAKIAPLPWQLEK